MIQLNAKCERLLSQYIDVTVTHSLFVHDAICGRNVWISTVYVCFIEGQHVMRDTAHHEMIVPHNHLDSWIYLSKQLLNSLDALHLHMRKGGVVEEGHLYARSRPISDTICPLVTHQYPHHLPPTEGEPPLLLPYLENSLMIRYSLRKYARSSSKYMYQSH